MEKTNMFQTNPNHQSVSLTRQVGEISFGGIPNSSNVFSSFFFVQNLLELDLKLHLHTPGIAPEPT